MPQADDQGMQVAWALLLVLLLAWLSGGGGKDRRRAQTAAARSAPRSRGRQRRRRGEKGGGEGGDEGGDSDGSESTASESESEDEDEGSKTPRGSPPAIRATASGGGGGGSSGGGGRARSVSPASARLPRSPERGPFAEDDCVCPGCGRGFASTRAVAGHSRHCDAAAQLRERQTNGGYGSALQLHLGGSGARGLVGGGGGGRSVSPGPSPPPARVARVNRGWAMPLELDSERPEKEPESPTSPVLAMGENDANGLQLMAPVPPPGWRVMHSKKHDRMYFYNVESLESRWCLPGLELELESDARLDIDTGT